MRHQDNHVVNANRSAWSTRSLVTALVAAGCLGILAGAVAANGDLSALIGAAREKFTPVGDEQLAAAKADLVSRANDLKRFVRPHTANGRKWLAYLRWDAVEAQLASDGPPDARPLVATLGQLNRDESGLELPPFRRLSDALQHYLVALTIARQENQADTYSKQLEGLANELQLYGQAPTPDVGAAIGLRLDLVDGLGQAPELVAAVRDEFARPNAFVTVSTKLLRDAAADPIDRDDPVTDCILGVSIHGQGHTIGSVALQTVPSDDKAVVELATDGRVVSQNIGRNGPAVIRTTAYTDFDSTQTVELTADDFRARSASVNARTTSDLHSVSKSGGGFGSKFVAKVGMKKAREKQGQANRIAADHAEDRIARRMNDEVQDRLHKAWNRYRDEYRIPLERRGELPEHIQFSTTEDALAFETTQANRGQLGAPGEPPSLSADQDLVVRMHETAVNNYTAAMLGGATISESDAWRRHEGRCPAPRLDQGRLEKPHGREG